MKATGGPIHESRRGRSGVAPGRRKLLRGALLLLALITACGGADAERPPRELTLGVDACEYCHMPVDDPLRAAQWVPQRGRILTFDEPGCLIAWLQRNPGAAGRAYVADGETGEWLAAQDAVYHLGGTRTGMGFDIVSYAEGAEVPAGGEVLRWDELLIRGVRDAHTH